MHLNYMEKILLPTYLKLQNTHKLSTIVGKNYDIYFPKMAKYALNLSTMVGEMFEIYPSQIVK